MTEHEHAVKMAEDEVKEAEANLAEAKRKAAHKEYPKWVEPHASHIDRRGDHVSTAHFEHHVDRDGKVTVKVDNEEHEAEAMAAKEAK